ncbi:MAG TPA: heme A synthase [Ktedonobacteraceae bacterium]|nr:heme A synthase [Ktedonobacteraceae bacterium]
MNSQRLIRIFAIITSIGAYVIIILGVLVTTSGSGQGCGNTWPFCHGQIIPGVITIAGLIEYSHRVMSSLEGFLVLVLTVWSWLMYRKDFRVKLFAFLSLLFVVLQGALGALTVVYEGTFALNWILSVHFGLSLIAFASVVLLTVRLFQVDRRQLGEPQRIITAVPRLQLPLWGLAVYTYIVVYTGALVEHTGAVTGCGYQIPGCGSTYFPNLTSLAGIQVLHRYVAGLLWVLVLCLLIAVMRSYRERRDIVQGAWWAFILITLQAVSGMFNVFTSGQMLAALVHTTLIASFFSVLCFLCVQVGWPWKGKREVQQIEDKQLELKTVP